MTAKRSRPGPKTEAAEDNKLAGDVVENGSHSTRESDLDSSLQAVRFVGEVR